MTSVICLLAVLRMIKVKLSIVVSTFYKESQFHVDRGQGRHMFISRPPMNIN